MATVAVMVTMAILIPAAVLAQELEPRAYSPSPIGTTFIAVTATRSAGGVFTDPSAPLKDADAEIGVLGLGLGYSFGLFGKSALVLGALPVTWGSVSGEVGEDRREVTRRGLADPRIKMSMILAGSKAMSAAEFARATHGTIFGVSLSIVPPVGQYDRGKLVNLGSNRWAFKPEVGVSIPLRRWTLDTYAAVWMFTDNGEYFTGQSVRHQDPVVALQAHVVYTFARRAWLAADMTWYAGGQSTVDGAPASGSYRNTRFGATFALPIRTHQSVKIGYSAGATTRVGADFQTITIGWQMVIF